MNYNIKNTLKNQNIFDGNYEELILEFTRKISTTNYRSTIISTLTELYTFLIDDKKLVSKMDSSLQISKITLEHILIFQSKIEQQVNRSEISKKIGENRLRIVNLFLKFLANKKLVIIFYKPISFFYRESVITSQSSPLILNDFKQFLNNKNYSKIITYLNNVKRFLHFSGYKDEISYTNDDWKVNLNKYEEFLRVQVIKELLTPASAYQYLRAIRLFYSYLYEEKMIFFKYKIPTSMINQATRNNEFITTQDALLVIDKILETSKDILRDLSIFLIILETGCRPLEVSNLTIDDINLKEKLITLKSVKSNQRTLKISSTVIYFIKAFLQIRRNYSPKDNVNSLFLTSIGTPISSDTIYKIFRKNVLATFGEMKFSPKSLRHTFITNALNNQNNIDDVAKTVGHKHLISTLYYFYRDLNSIKQIIIGKELNLEGD